MKIRDAVRRPWALAGGALVVGTLTAALVAPGLVAAQNSEDDADPEHDSWSLPSVATCIENVADRPTQFTADFLDELVEDGVVDQEQADEIESRLHEELEGACVSALLHQPLQAITATADVTGVSELDVLMALGEGQSLAEFAAEHGVDEEELVAAIMAPSEEQAAELVANGDLEQTEADELLADIEEKVRERITSSIDGLPFNDFFGEHEGFRDAFEEGLDSFGSIFERWSTN